MEPSEANNQVEEAEDVGADATTNGQPLILGSEDTPVRLNIDGGRNLQLVTRGNGSIRDLHLDDFGSIAIEFSKERDVESPKNEYTLRYRSIFNTGGSLGILSCVVHDDRETFRAARSNKGANLNPTRSAPYAVVRDPRLRVRLTGIAGYIEYLDRGFAEYFQVAGCSDDREAVGKLLKYARQYVQERKPSSCSYTGELGKFCESVFATWERSSETTEWVHYRPRLRNDEDKIEYLQDALEIPYWDFMIKSFMDWRHSNSNHVGANGILYVLNHITATCRRRIRKINEEASYLGSQEQEAVNAVIGGVEQRLELLDGVLFGTTIDLEDLDDGMTKERQEKSGSSELAPERDISNTSSETSTLIGLVFGFLILSTTFFCKGFAISWVEKKTGSFDDADFWYLCQSNVMFVLGSLATAMPLLKHHSLERTRATFWLSFAVGLVTAIISIAIYTHMNTCYSALVAFLGSVASAGSLLALTQATSQGSHGKATVQDAKPRGQGNKLKEQ
ncbi:hypothetical protein F5B21DRAFT_484625 [Xylaria acuta]|nr:hypothetical protein F5B21DRAFT_484625 [Xylaria acuta]